MIEFKEGQKLLVVAVLHENTLPQLFRLTMEELRKFVKDRNLTHNDYAVFIGETFKNFNQKMNVKGF